MNDETGATDIEARDASPAVSRSDNYDRYLEDAYGYAYSARDIVAVEHLERHDDLVTDPTLADREATAEDLDDFVRLGLARGLRQAGDLEGFCEQIDHLLDSDGEHPAVAYPEIPLLAALVLRDADRYEQARAFLERGRERWPAAEVPMIQQQALVALATDGLEAAQSIYQSLVDDNPDDAELRYEVAEDLWRFGERQAAREWAKRAEEAAERVGDDPLLVDIRLLQKRLAD